MKVDIDKIRQFAESHFKYSDRPDYSFRNRYTHTMRVLKWAERLHKELGGDLEIIKIAVLLHDIGWDHERNHAFVSAEIAEEYLKEYDIEKERLDIILEAIYHHNLNDTLGLHHESYIVMDADELDELGALTIVWDCMATAIKDEPSFEKAYERISFFYKKLQERKVNCYFDYTKKIYQERMDLIGNFLKELSYELGYSEKD